MGDSRERPPSPSECLQWFNIKANHSFRPVTTGHQELMDFFRALIQEAWDDVRLQLRRHLLDRLSSRGPDHPGTRRLSVPEQIRCLQQLFFLYPQSEALTYYQCLRSQSVPVLLLSALSSSPGGESGFDGLAEGFRLAVPALTRALTEELRVLSRLAEPQAVLGFLNKAYLDSVARELASLMERECEAALRDNTTLSGKIKKYSARSRATVAALCGALSLSQGLFK
ncbi:hypothetical protein EYF80_049645 [Liparis tanakae]|uniref:Uncharacterized protein n=1 Tax=Liparis tanakae TaxID=230148 RepID=A0A4Z2FHD3_9TELE|nr:hypothetical protein EYF80_049645 [Liparis tanakae]